MLLRIFAIIQNSFREMYRDRFFLILVFGVILFFILSLLLGELSFEEHKKILFDLGISSIHWLNLGLCLFIGGNSLRRELDRQTYMSLLSSPLSRTELILGKFGGVFAVSVVSTVLLGSGLWVLLNAKESSMNFATILVGVVVEAGVLLSLAILMNLLMSSFVAMFASGGVFLMGHWLESLKHFADKSKMDSYKQFANLCDWLIPNLYRLNWRSLAILENGIAPGVFFSSIIQGLAWIIIIITASKIIFERKNLT